MLSRIAHLLQCPSMPGGLRCTGRLIERDRSLVCDICASVFRLAERDMPVLRTEQQSADEIWYDHAYATRSRTQDLAEGAYNVDKIWLRKLIPDQGIGGPSLDIGCGTGIFAAELPGFVGLDYSVAAVTSAGTDGFDFVCGSAEQLPFRDATFGCVFSINALEHVPRPDLAFEEIDRVLKPGGHVLLNPAWHCTRYDTELLPIKPYRELRLRQKITKFMLPVLTSRPYKLAKFLPWRGWRRMTARRPTRLAFVPLTPNFTQWIADSDAAASIDCHEGILFFESRGYACISHSTIRKRLLAGHDWIVLRKP